MEKPPGTSRETMQGGTPNIKNMKNNKHYAIFDFSLYGRWEDLDRWKWVVIDVGVILDAFASHSENFFFRHFFELVRIAIANGSQKLEV